MKNFKEIAEKCLAGELSGTFVLRNGDKCISSNFKKVQGSLTSFKYAEHYYSDNGHCYTISGYKSKFDIIDFIPNNMEKLIKIDIPEGRVPVVEQIENGVVITWKEKELTYEDIKDKLSNDRKYIGNFCYNTMSPNLDTQAFYRKMGVLHKLVNIRNYFGKPDNMLEGWCIFKHSLSHKLYVDKEYCTSQFKVAFAKKEHAEQAIKMLGDELKYLFEPW
jgi:hypothetical protein